MRATARRLGKKLTGKLNPCSHCLKAKAKKQHIDKETEKLDVLPGKRMDLDLTGCKKKSFGGNQYANVKRDYGSTRVEVTFMKKKSEVTEDMLKCFKAWKENLDTIQV